MAVTAAPARSRTRLQRWISTFTFLVGLGTTAWVVLGYAMMKAREARLRASDERAKKDRLRAQFSSTMSNISFTLYGLLPTLSTQLFQQLDVESVTEELTTLGSKSGATGAGSDTPASLSTSTSTLLTTSESSQATSPEAGPSRPLPNVSENEPSTGLGISSSGDMTTSVSSLGGMTDITSTTEDAAAVSKSVGPGASWASEFYQQQATQGPSAGRQGPPEDEGLTSSAFSQSISLPEQSGSSGSSHGRGSSSETHSSPPYLHSPPMSASESPMGPRKGKGRDLSPAVVVSRKEAAKSASGGIDAKGTKSKVKLWNEIKVKAITRSITSIYLIPLLLLQTSSQITLLSRLHYLRSLSAPNLLEGDDGRPKKTLSWVEGVLTPWTFFSVDEMGLGDFELERQAPQSLLGRVTSALFTTSKAPTPPSKPTPTPLEQIVDDETEELFLCFSWWFLHIGWKTLEARVEKAAKEVLKTMSVKQEMTMADWQDVVFQIRRSVEMDGDGIFDFSALLLPPNFASQFASGLDMHGQVSDCPIPSPPHPEPLASLLAQARAHFASTDATVVLSAGFDTMQQELLGKIDHELYREPSSTKRMAACLATLSRWSRTVWEAAPGEAVERLTGLSENEAFTAVVFGDFGA